MRFCDLVALLEALGFEERRRSGSHRVFLHPDLPELVSVQEVNGEAKP